MIIKKREIIEYCKECKGISIIKKGPRVHSYQQAIAVLVSIVIILSLELAKLHIS